MISLLMSDPVLQVGKYHFSDLQLFEELGITKIEGPRAHHLGPAKKRMGSHEG